MRFDTLLLASQNKGKLAEMRSMLQPLNITVEAASAYTIPPFPPEDGDSYRANAFIKSRHLHQHTGLACLGDDSGLEVLALDNAPGIYSARYGDKASDAERNTYLLQQLNAKLEHNPSLTRVALFVCGLALVLPDGSEHYFQSECKGSIVETAQGNDGFGYDPLFFSPELGKTFGQSSKEEKARVSHRGRALSKFLHWVLAQKSNVHQV